MFSFFIRKPFLCPKKPECLVKYEFVKDFVFTRAKSGNFQSPEIEVENAFKIYDLLNEGMNNDS